MKTILEVSEKTRELAFRLYFEVIMKDPVLLFLWNHKENVAEVLKSILNNL